MGGVCRLLVNGSYVEGPACTDNFQIVSPKFKVFGHEFHSVEQAYQATKFPTGSPPFVAVRDARPAGKSDEEFGLDVWALGNGNQKDVVPGWQVDKVRMMYIANLCKFSQHPSLAASLAATAPWEIRARPSTWRWQHFNGRIMTRIRNVIQRGGLESELLWACLTLGKVVQAALEQEV